MASLSGAMQAKIKHPETNKQQHGRVTQCIQTPHVLLTIHQIQDEAQFIWRVEGIGHTDDERTILE